MRTQGRKLKNKSQKKVKKGRREKLQADKEKEEKKTNKGHRRRKEEKMTEEPKEEK